MKLVFCERYGTKMTQGACDRFREKTPERCHKCEGPKPGAVLDEVRETAKPPAIKKENDMATAKKQNTCKCCKESKRIIGRGLCGACYARERASGTLNKNYPSSYLREAVRPAPEVVETEPVPVPTVEQQPVPTVEPEPTPTDRRDRADNRIKKVEVNFLQRDAELLKNLEMSADINRRTLGAEILFRLEQWMGS